VEQQFYPIFDLMWREVWTNISKAFPNEDSGNAIRTTLTSLLKETQGDSRVNAVNCEWADTKIGEEVDKMDNNEFRSAGNHTRGKGLAKLINATKELVRKNEESGGGPFTQDSGAEIAKDPRHKDLIDQIESAILAAGSGANRRSRSHPSSLQT